MRHMLDFKEKNEALALESKNSNIILDRLADLSRAVTNAQLKTIEAKADYEIIQRMVSDLVTLKAYIKSERGKGVIISSENQHPRLHRELDLLRRELADLGSEVGADHPSVKEKEAKIKQIEMQLADLDKKLAEAQLTMAMQQYHSAQQREKEIGKAFEEQKQMALKLNDRIAQYTILESDYQQSRKASELIEHRIKELKMTEDVGALNIAILEIATPADRPSAPQKGRTLALALMLGMVSGGGLSLLKGLMDHS
jgi:succinoglycan biosynthesis transport protein ExoP